MVQIRAKKRVPFCKKRYSFSIFGKKVLLVPKKGKKKRYEPPPPAVGKRLKWTYMHLDNRKKKVFFFCDLESQKYMVDVKFQDKSNGALHIFCYDLSIMSKNGLKG